jgi:hypothetical protein
MKKMNKKGQVYMAFLVILALTFCSMLVVTLNAKKEPFTRDVGERQTAVLAAVQEGEKAQYYIDLSAVYAYDEAVLKLAKHWYDVDTDCEMYRGVPVVYGDNDCMRYDLEDTLENDLSVHFNDALNRYLIAYEEVILVQNNFMLQFGGDGSVIALGLEPLSIPIMSTTSADVVAATMDDAMFVLGAESFSVWPVVYDQHVVTSCFGGRKEVISGTRKSSTSHAGVDMRAPVGTPIVSVADGTVVSSDPIRWGRVVVDHGKGISTEYLHLDTVIVVEGQVVVAGEQVGTSGIRAPTGGYAPHLHFSVNDQTLPDNLADSNGNEGVLTDFSGLPYGGDGYVNSLCYLDLVENEDYTFKSRSTTSNGCATQGGPYKFCNLYAGYH